MGNQEMLVLSYEAAPVELPELTPVEREVARLAADGLSNALIAKARGTAVRTVANQMASILAKLKLASRHELAVLMHASHPKLR